MAQFFAIKLSQSTKKKTKFQRFSTRARLNNFFKFIPVILLVVPLIVFIIAMKIHFPFLQYASGTNPIQQENLNPGTTAWQINKPSKNGEIQGYLGKDSINTGDNVNLYVSTKVPDTYQIDIYRLGYYGGNGGTLKQAITGNNGVSQGYYLNAAPFASYPTNCPTCMNSKKDANGIEMNIEDANWTVSSTITFPTNWISGVYEIVLTESSGYQWGIPLVVRDDARPSALTFQAPFNTDQAYNVWGGSSLYRDCRDFPSTCTSTTSAYWAYEISYNRPYLGNAGTGYLFSWWYNMVRFMEWQGYDVTYTTNMAVADGKTNLLNYKGFLSAGHDEYWSSAERQKLEQGITNGLNVAFFGGNSIYWQIRNDADNNGTADRNIICYKQANVDPINIPPNNSNSYLTTVKWRQSPVNDAEDKLLKSMYIATEDSSTFFDDFVATNSASWVYANTGLHDGDHIPKILGYEMDAVFSDGSITPSDHVTIIGSSPFIDQSTNTQLTSNATLNELSSTGNIVFNAGSIYWPLGLTDYRGNSNIPESAALEQITNNILQRMIQGSSVTPTLMPTTSPSVTPTIPPTNTPTPTPTPSPTPTLTPTPTSSYQSTILNDKPLAYWRLGETSGTVANDTSAHNYKGTYNSGVKLGVPGAINHDTNTAVSSTGTGMISLPNFSSVTNFTVEGWTYLTDPNWNSGSGYNNALYGKYGYVRLLIHPGAPSSNPTIGYFGVWISGKEYTLLPTTNGVSDLNQWVYWALVRNGSTLALYRNGSQLAKRTDLPSTATANISGTALSTSGSYSLKGNIDELAVYTTALSASQVQSHYNSAL